MTDTPKENIFSGIIDMEALRSGFVLADLNKILICAGDVGNAFLYGSPMKGCISLLALNLVLNYKERG